MINIEYEDYYCNKENVERTKERLIELSNLWLSSVWYGEFWIDKLLSWIYIERIWWYSDEKWLEEIVWIKSVIENKIN